MQKPQKSQKDEVFQEICKDGKVIKNNVMQLYFSWNAFASLLEVDCSQPSIFSYFYSKGMDRIMRTGCQCKMEDLNPTPTCFALALLTFSFVCVNREAVNSLEEESEFIEEKSEFIEEKSEIIEEKSKFIEEKSEFIEEKSEFIEEKSEFIEEKSEFIEEKSEFIEEKSEFIEEKSEFIEEKSEFIQDISQGY